MKVKQSLAQQQAHTTSDRTKTVILKKHGVKIFLTEPIQVAPLCVSRGTLQGFSFKTLIVSPSRTTQRAFSNTRCHFFHSFSESSFSECSFSLCSFSESVFCSGRKGSRGSIRILLTLRKSCSLSCQDSLGSPVVSSESEAWPKHSGD